MLSGNLAAPATLSYDIRDLTGRLIYEGVFPENATVSRSFDLRSAAPGIYLLRLVGPDGSSQQFRMVRQ